MRRLLEDVSQRAIRYLEDLDKRNVAPSQEAISRLLNVQANLPCNSTSAEDVLLAGEVYRRVAQRYCA